MPFPAKYPGVATVPKRIPLRLCYILLHKFVPWMLRQESRYNVVKVALINLDDIRTYKLHGKDVIRVEDIKKYGVINTFCTTELHPETESEGEGEA